MLECRGAEKIDCFNIQDFTSEQNRIAIQVLTIHFIPTSRFFFFRSKRNQNLLESFLKHLQQDKTQRNYRRKSITIFLTREFELIAGSGRKYVHCQDVQNYFKKHNIFAPIIPSGRFSSYQDFSTVVKNIMARKSEVLRTIFTRYSETVEGQQFILEDMLALFMRQHQHQDQGVDIPLLISTYQDQGGVPGLGYQEFQSYLCSEDNSITHTIEQDMAQPMSMYWIHSSHNTYLRGGQVGDADIRAYQEVLRMGARCIEIDIWDGHEPMPMVYHGAPGGLSMSSKLRLDEVLKTIDKFAFISSDYPLIISLEIHCNKKNQKILAKLMTEIFGDKLLTRKHCETEHSLPSPADLKNKISLKGYKNAITETKKDEPCVYISPVSVSYNGTCLSQTTLLLEKNTVICGDVCSLALDYSTISLGDGEDGDGVVVIKHSGDQLTIATPGTDITTLWSSLVQAKHARQVSSKLLLS